MPIQHFTLIVDGADLQSEPLIDALFEAGCDDATVGRVNGVQYVDFDREAESLGEAVISAVRDVEKVDGVQVARVADAGLVSMTDIATRLGRTRESVRLLVTGARGPGDFPAPVTDPRGPLPALALVRRHALAHYETRGRHVAGRASRHRDQCKPGTSPLPTRVLRLSSAQSEGARRPFLTARNLRDPNQTPTPPISGLRQRNHAGPRPLKQPCTCFFLLIAR